MVGESIAVADRRARSCRRQAEVEDLHVAVGGDEDVLRLQIAMDDAALVRGGEPLGDLRALNSIALRTGSAPAASRSRSVLAFEQLHDRVQTRP